MPFEDLAPSQTLATNDRVMLSPWHHCLEELVENKGKPSVLLSSGLVQKQLMVRTLNIDVCCKKIDKQELSVASGKR